MDVKYALSIINGKWKANIIWELSQVKTVRFNELQRRLGDVSGIMLSKSLKELESYGLIERIQYNEIPPRVEYSLTDIGMELKKPLTLIGKWGERVQVEMKKNGQIPKETVVDKD